MNNNINKLDSSLKKYNNLIVINQIPKKLSGSFCLSEFDSIKWVDYDQKGLSKSRNLGLNISDKEYLYLTDDDVVLNENFEEIVTQSISENPDVDVFAFQVTGIEKKFKDYPSKRMVLNLFQSLKLSSVQLIIKSCFLRKNSIQYDELFGAGSMFKMGEENILLTDIKRKSGKILYIPEEIAKVHIGKSSWFEGYTEKYFFDRGAIYSRMFGRTLGTLMSFLFVIRKKNIFKNSIRLKDAFLQMIKGSNYYAKLQGKR